MQQMRLSRTRWTMQEQRIDRTPFAPLLDGLLNPRNSVPGRLVFVHQNPGQRVTIHPF
jgi:hypothetical protein